MGITVIWDDEAHTILRTLYEGLWTWEEYQAASVQAGMMLNESSHRIDGIIDIRGTRYVPSGYLEAMRAMARVSLIPQIGIIVIIGEHVAYEMFDTFARQEGGVSFRYAYAASLKMAYAIIEASRIGQAWISDVPPTAPGAN